MLAGLGFEIYVEEPWHVLMHRNIYAAYKTIYSLQILHFVCICVKDGASIW